MTVKRYENVATGHILHTDGEKTWVAKGKTTHSLSTIVPKGKHRAAHKAISDAYHKGDDHMEKTLKKHTGHAWVAHGINEEAGAADLLNTEQLAEAVRRTVDKKGNPTVGHLAVRKDMHKLVNKTPDDVHAHLDKVAKSHGYDHHVDAKSKGDRHNEDAPGAIGFGSYSHTHHVLTHKATGAQEHVFVSTRNGGTGKCSRIGHHTSTNDKHLIHTPGFNPDHSSTNVFDKGKNKMSQTQHHNHGTGETKIIHHIKESLIGEVARDVLEESITTNA